MAKTSQVVITASLTGDGYNVNYTSAGSPNASAPAPFILPLVAGFNGFTIASGAIPTGIQNGILVIPPTNSVNTKTIKGVTGDTGVSWQTTSQAMYIPFTGASGATLGITSGATESLFCIPY